MPRGEQWPSHRVVELVEEGSTQEDRKSSQHEGKMVDKDVKHLHIPIYHEDCYKAGVDPGFLEREFTCINVGGGGHFADFISYPMKMKKIWCH